MFVFGIWYLLRVDDYPTQGKAVKVTFIKVLDLALMISITNYVLIPQLLYKKQYVLFILFLLILFSSIIKMNILGRLLNNPELLNLSGNLKKRIYDNIIPHFFLVTAGAAIKLMFDYGALQKRMGETAKEKAEAELNFLKSQINPHFVFNSLNAIYFLINKDNADARGALHKLLRYQLYEVNDDKIPIEKEIHYLKDYVDLQQLRKDENYSVQFNCAPDVKGFSIEPLLLVPFVENAFKHISHHNNNTNYVRVDMFLANKIFIFSVVNSKEQQPTKPTVVLNGKCKQTTGVTLSGKHELKIDDTEKHCSIKSSLA
jgi:sensor histidine kinase YesM